MNLPATAQVPQAPSGPAKGTITLRNRVNERVFIEMQWSYIRVRNKGEFNLKFSPTVVFISKLLL